MFTATLMMLAGLNQTGMAEMNEMRLRARPALALTIPATVEATAMVQPLPTVIFTTSPQQNEAIPCFRCPRVVTPPIPNGDIRR